MFWEDALYLWCDLVESLMMSEGRFWGWVLSLVLWVWWGFYEDITSKMLSGGVFGCLVNSDIMHHYL